MNQLIQKISQKYCKTKVPVLKPGYEVRVHQKIKEGNKERVQVFQGMVIKTNSGHGVSHTFTVRKISEGIGVEKTFPIHSPNIVKVDVLRAHKVRRSKLYFLRNLSGKALRLKEVPLKLQHTEFEKKEESKAESIEQTQEKQSESKPEIASDEQAKTTEEGNNEKTVAEKDSATETNKKD